jgi:hypothetical protein
MQYREKQNQKVERQGDLEIVSYETFRRVPRVYESCGHVADRFARSNKKAGEVQGPADANPTCVAKKRKSGKPLAKRRYMSARVHLAA